MFGEGDGGSKQLVVGEAAVVNAINESRVGVVF